MRTTKWKREDLVEAVAKSFSVTETMRNLELAPTGSNSTVNKYIKLWGIDTSHFLSQSDRVKGIHKQSIPLSDVLVDDSPYSRKDLKKRLYATGLKQRACELCGQGEEWKGKKMSLILDHINGKRNDNRLENLQIVCPNCNATLDTHAGRNNIKLKSCIVCKESYRKRNKQFCSKECAQTSFAQKRRKTTRPDISVLKDLVQKIGYCATGRLYNVSDNAIRKWLKV